MGRTVFFPQIETIESNVNSGSLPCLGVGVFSKHCNLPVKLDNLYLILMDPLKNSAHKYECMLSHFHYKKKELNLFFKQKFETCYIFTLHLTEPQDLF